jgi:phosphatidylserine/phosphatidylglycerophosphate/cardiolipin synthase-like enzyme
MAKFLNTSAITYHLEQMINEAADRLILISPYLKLNARIRELLEDKNRLKIDVRIVYGKNELHPSEIKWLEELTYIRCSYCPNLHAKCYLNQSTAIIGSMNLYEFSQVNNNEMGVLISRDDDSQLYEDAFQESQRLIRISDEVRISVETVPPLVDTPAGPEEPPSWLSSSRLAKIHGLRTNELLEKLAALGWVEKNGDDWQLTESGKQNGGEPKSGRFGHYIAWPAALRFEKQ